MKEQMGMTSLLAEELNFSSSYNFQHRTSGYNRYTRRSVHQLHTDTVTESFHIESYFRKAKLR